ncbi:hypothetical protein [Hyphobacterium sp.]|uniref:hypothetical protein n=1 Tax=Hyphobacterium sp. TaxID=2004662 RepID=UPI003BAC217B
MMASRAKRKLLDTQVELKLAPIRKERARTKRLFFIGSIASVGLGTAIGFLIYSYWPGAAIFTGLAVAAAGANFAHRPLAGIDRKIRRLVEAAMLEPYGLDSVDSVFADDKTPVIAELGLVPRGLEYKHAHRYQSKALGLSIEELRIKGMPMETPVGRVPRILFYGQVLERTLDSLEIEPFILLPRRYEITSQIRHQRDLFLADAYLRSERKDVALSQYYQVWGRKSVEGDIVPDRIREAAIKARYLFPQNQLAISVTRHPQTGWSLHMSVDIGGLYRTEKSVDAPLADETLAYFHDNLRALMQAQQLILDALDQNSNVPTTGT